MLYYQKYRPSLILQPFVECFYIWEWHIGKVPRFVESPPSGFTSLVINYGSIYKAGHNGLTLKDVPRSFVSGQLIYRYQIWLEGQIGMACVVFKPGGMAHVFNIPMYELSGERVCFERITGRKGRELVEQIGSVGVCQRKCRVVPLFKHPITFGAFLQ